MIPCAILGDSLASGVASVRSDCLSDTKVGIASAAYAAGHKMHVSANTVLISLGVNDGQATIGTARHLTDLRAGIKARRVYWLLPAKPEITRQLIAVIAEACGDQVIETRGMTGPDGLHLTGTAYRAVSRMLDPPLP